MVLIYRMSAFSSGKEDLGNFFDVPEIMMSEKKGPLDSSPSLSGVVVSPIVNKRNLGLYWGCPSLGGGGVLRDPILNLHKFWRKLQKTLNG